MICMLAPRYLTGRDEIERRFGKHMVEHQRSTQISNVLINGVKEQIKVVAYADRIWAEEKLRGHRFTEVLTVGVVPPKVLEYAMACVRT